jgi:BASS family bile acid:Na+ symporter
MEIARSFQEIYVSLFSVVTMLGMGLGVTFGQITATVRRRWKALLWGIAFNCLMIPVAALSMRDFVTLDQAFFTGFFLCMAAPGGGTGSLLTYCAKGDVPFSITLMFPLTLVSLFATPLWMAAASGNAAADPWTAVIPMMTTLACFLFAPFVAGIFIRWKYPAHGAFLAGPVTRASMIMLLLLVVGYLAARGDQITAGGGRLILLSLGAAAAALAGGLTLAPHGGRRRALGFTSSIRNVTAAILLAGTCYTDPKTMIGVLAYGLAQFMVCFPAAFAAARMVGRDGNRSAAGGFSEIK